MDSRVFSLRDTGNNAMKRGDYDLAITLFNQAIQLDREYLALYSDRGQAYFNKGDYKQAISDYKIAFDGMPENNFYREQYQGAKAAAEKAVAEEQRKAREAAEKLRRAAEQGDAEAQFKLGRSYFDGQGVGITKDYAKAAEWFGKAAEQGHAEAKDWFAKASEADKIQQALIAKFRKRTRIGLILQIGVTIAAFYLWFFSSLAYKYLAVGNDVGGFWMGILMLALPAGIPALVIGIISLLFRRRVGDFAGVCLLIVVYIVLLISMITRAAESAGDGILVFVLFTIFALPGFFMAKTEDADGEQKARWIILAGGIIAGVLLLSVDNSHKNSVTVPDGVTSIGEYEFAHKYLGNVAIPSSVTLIDKNAFLFNKLTSVEIPNSVTTIGKNAFCFNKLTSIKIPDNVISIGEDAFSSNPLTSVTIGANATLNSNSFGSGFEAAYDKNDKRAGTYGRLDTKSKEWWYVSDFKYQNHDGNITITGYNGTGSTVTVPSAIDGNPVTAIGERAFRNNSLSMINIPSSVTTIGVSAFADNPVTRVRIGANVTLGDNGDNGILGSGTGFNGAYAKNGRKAGTYRRPNANSTKWKRK